MQSINPSERVATIGTMWLANRLTLDVGAGPLAAPLLGCFLEPHPLSFGITADKVAYGAESRAPGLDPGD
jgi:hypothetical protein